MAAVVTHGGAAYIVAQHAAGNPVVIDSIQVGTLTPSQRYDAVATATALVDPTPSATFNATGFSIIGVANELGINLTDSSSDAYRASEIGYFAGSILVFVAAEQASDLYNKAADTPARASLRVVVSGNVVTSVSVSIATVLPSTQTQVEAGTDNATFITPLTLRGAQEYTQKYPHRTGLAETFDSLRQQGVYNVRNPEGRSDGPTGAGNNDAKLEVVHTQYRQLGRLDIIQEVSTSAGAIFTREGTITGTAGTVPDWDGNPLPTAVWTSWTRTGLTIASQTEAVATSSQNNTNAMTPLRVWQAMAAFVRNASTTVRGYVELATNDEGTAGTDAERAMTPAATRAAIDARITGKITISNSAPQSSDGVDNDIWLEY